MGIIVPTSLKEVSRHPLIELPYCITSQKDKQGHVVAQVVGVHCTTLGGPIHADCTTSCRTEKVPSHFWASIYSSIGQEWQMVSVTSSCTDPLFYCSVTLSGLIVFYWLSLLSSFSSMVIFFQKKTSGYEVFFKRASKEAQRN